MESGAQFRRKIACPRPLSLAFQCFRMPLLVLIASVAFGGKCSANAGEVALAALTAQIGSPIWSTPEKRLVRATIYKKGKEAKDPNSKKGKSDEKIRLRYATSKEAGTLAAPQWLPRGSMVRIHTKQGDYCYIAADEGRAIEKRHASKKTGKTKEQKSAPVLDFCADKQAWPDFVNVEIYYYAGKVPFSDLNADEQKALFVHAKDYATKKR